MPLQPAAVAAASTWVELSDRADSMFVTGLEVEMGKQAYTV